MERRRVKVYYTGYVQGVGFRYTVKRLAMGYEVVGVVRNLSDGRVELIAEGERVEIEQFLQAIRDSEVGRFIRSEDISWCEPTGEMRGFHITG
ncbi:MAG TPA: acylphosphatase [Verrucomicrobiota bacterium]|nr:acylphosphatase [Verrucomicrobiota bacterium]